MYRIPDSLFSNDLVNLIGKMVAFCLLSNNGYLIKCVYTLWII